MQSSSLVHGPSLGTQVHVGNIRTQSWAVEAAIVTTMEWLTEPLHHLVTESRWRSWPRSTSKTKKWFGKWFGGCTGGWGGWGCWGELRPHCVIRNPDGLVHLEVGRWRRSGRRNRRRLGRLTYVPEQAAQLMRFGNERQNPHRVPTDRTLQRQAAEHPGHEHGPNAAAARLLLIVGLAGS
jgi:hypothetical protein